MNLMNFSLESVSLGFSFFSSATDELVKPADEKQNMLTRGYLVIRSLLSFRENTDI